MNDDFNQFALKEKKREHTGKIIVLTISIVNLILAALSFFVDFKPITLAVNIISTILFMRGFDWIRILFAWVMAWDSVWLVFSFCFTVSDMKWWAIILYIVTITYSISATALLFASRSVKEYLYVRKNG